MNLAAITVTSGLLIHEALRRFSNSDVPWATTTTAISLTAHVHVGPKAVENWLLWIFVNVLYVGLYCYKKDSSSQRSSHDIQRTVRDGISQLERELASRRHRQNDPHLIFNPRPGSRNIFQQPGQQISAVSMDMA